MTRQDSVTTKHAVWAVILMILPLASCAANKFYQPPPPDPPAQWSRSSDIQPRDEAALTVWWQQFSDPVLDKLVGQALAANLDLATARAKLRQARAQRDLAAAQMGPTINGSASASKSKASSNVGGGRTTNLYSTGFDASWEIDIFGELRRKAEAAEADLGATAETLHDTQVSLVAEVVINYIDLRTAERRLAIARESLASLGEIYDLARWRRKAGLVSDLDVDQAQTEMESARAALPALQTTAANARNRLAVLLGRVPEDSRAQLMTTAAIPVAPRTIAIGIPADTLRQRPDVRAAERKLAAEAARLGAAKATQYPSLTLSGSIGLEALSLSGLGSGAGLYAFASSLTAPVFDSGRISANIEAQDAVLEQARAAYRASILVALEDVENALAKVSNTAERRDRLDQAARAARETTRLAEQRYSAGLADFLTVLDAQRTQQDLEDQLAASSGDLATAQAQLYKALGGGWSVTGQTG